MKNYLAFIVTIAVSSFAFSANELDGKYYLGRLHPDQLTVGYTETYLATCERRFPCKLVVENTPRLIGMNENNNLFHTSPIVKIIKKEAGYQFHTLSGSIYYVSFNNFKSVTNEDDLKFFYDDDILKLKIAKRISGARLKEMADNGHLLRGQRYREYEIIEALEDIYFTEAKMIADL